MVAILILEQTNVSSCLRQIQELRDGTKDDIIICISKSGNPEIKVVVPFFKTFGNTLIAITGNMTSFLAKGSDVCLNTTVDAELVQTRLYQ
jgi:D-arabinose 5-phosphate isomerase GutQ